MCGIVGGLNLDEPRAIPADLIPRMLAMIRHRGPDAFGAYRDPWIALGNARLSIIDLEGGLQPISNEDESIWVVFNGEIFNYIELRAELEACGHRFRTRSDTEVIVHLYEELGEGAFERLNGQFAIALWDRGRRRLLLARDRVGIRPLFYTLDRGRLFFASEVKALLAVPGMTLRPRLEGIAQVFTLWTTLPGETPFEGVWSLRPGHLLIVEEGVIRDRTYWRLSFAPPDGRREWDVDAMAEELYALLADAVRLRLRADVPVGAYLSGGLDSSTISLLTRECGISRLETFSVAFADPNYDESQFQCSMAAELGTRHHVIKCREVDIGRVFPAVVWHAEVPLLRTAPAPLYMLSGLVRAQGFKVVLTGEGADELLGGYNIFKEAKVRRFWARDPSSMLRPLLLSRLYPYLELSGGGYLQHFFGYGLTEVDDPAYSHRIRWRNTARLWRFFSPEVRETLRGYDPAEVFLSQADPEIERWTPLARAQYIEIALFMSNYLLAAQGDRPAMAHAVEGRFPFLDHRVVAFCNALPPEVKIRGLTEKYLLRRAMRGRLPEGICRRSKRPYRAPIGGVFFGAQMPSYVPEVLSPEALRASGLFDPTLVGHLVRKARDGARLSETEEMGVVGIISAQLWHRQFIRAEQGREIRPVRLDRDVVKEVSFAEV